MTSKKSIYQDLEENYFTKKELKTLLVSVGIENITEVALDTLGKFISDYGRILTQLAMFHDQSIENQIFDVKDLKNALEIIHTYQPPSIFYIWIMSGNGTCLYSKSFSNMVFPDTIFSGMLVGIHVLAKELTGRSFERIDMEDLSLYLNESSDLIGGILAKSESDASLLNKTLLIEFLSIFADELLKKNIDVNLFRSFDKISRSIIRDWPFIKPDITTEIRRVLLEADSIEQELSTGFKKEDLEFAMNEIRNLEIFKSSNDNSTQELEKILEEKFKFSENDKKRFKIDFKTLIPETEK